MRLAFALVLLCSSGPALACDCVRLIPGGPRFEEDLDRIAPFYTVAAEGVIERDGPYNWRFTPDREFRGTGQKSYPIALISDCSLAPNEVATVLGKRIFALLVEGPGDYKGSYELSRCVNLLDPRVEDALRKRIAGACKPR